MWTRAVMACYVIWGLLPLLYAMLAPSGAAELVASRIVWGFGLCMAIVAIHGQTRAVLDILRNPRALVITAASAALLGLNWGTHIVAILTGQVVDAGIGYLLTPLLSVILGAIVLRQRLSVQQWLGVALAGAALLVIGAGYGSVPWVVLLLPLSWAIYGLVKQKFLIEAPVLVSFTAELSLLAPIGFGLLAWLGLTGQATTWTTGSPHLLLLASTGFVTVVPLLLLNASVRQLRLATLGMLQYISAVFQVILGVVHFAEPMSLTRSVGLGLVAAGVVVFATARTGSQVRRAAGAVTQRSADPPAELMMPANSSATRVAF